MTLQRPSTPLLPEVFTDTPVTWLSGIRIESPGRVLRVVSEGGGTRNISPYVQKVNLHLPRGSGDISYPSPQNVSTIASGASRARPAAANNRITTGAGQ